MSEKIAEKNGISLQVMIDEDPESPREWENLGKMCLKHRRYNFPKECEEEDFENALITLPVYMFDHSGIKLSTQDFNDPWDSGQIGWIAAFEDGIKKSFECNEITDDIKRKVMTNTVTRLTKTIAAAFLINSSDTLLLKITFSFLPLI